MNKGPTTINRHGHDRRSAFSQFAKNEKRMDRWLEASRHDRETASAARIKTIQLLTQLRLLLRQKPNITPAEAIAFLEGTANEN